MSRKMVTATSRFVPTKKESLFLRIKLLKLLQRGKANAIPGKDLAYKLGFSDDRKIRVAIRELIHEGHKIASSVSEPYGYYIVANENEAAEYKRVLSERIKEDMDRLADFEAACKDMTIPEQLSLIGG